MAVSKKAGFIREMHINNHPPGNLEPSKSAIELMKKLLETADTNGLKLIDHVINGFEGFYSFTSESKLANRFGWY